MQNKDYLSYISVLKRSVDISWDLACNACLVVSSGSEEFYSIQSREEARRAIAFAKMLEERLDEHDAEDSEDG